MYKKYTVVGHGGISCRCCCNLGGKPTVKRIAKRRLNHAIKKIIKELLNETN